MDFKEIYITAKTLEAEAQTKKKEAVEALLTELIESAGCKVGGECVLIRGGKPTEGMVLLGSSAVERGVLHFMPKKKDGEFSSRSLVIFVGNAPDFKFTVDKLEPKKE